MEAASINRNRIAPNSKCSRAMRNSCSPVAGKSALVVRGAPPRSAEESTVESEQVGGGSRKNAATREARASGEQTAWTCTKAAHSVRMVPSRPPSADVLVHIVKYVNA